MKTPHVPQRPSWFGPDDTAACIVLEGEVRAQHAWGDETHALSQEYVARELRWNYGIPLGALTPPSRTATWSRSFLDAVRWKDGDKRPGGWSIQNELELLAELTAKEALHELVASKLNIMRSYSKWLSGLLRKAGCEISGRAESTMRRGRMVPHPLLTQRARRGAAFREQVQGLPPHAPKRPLRLQRPSTGPRFFSGLGGEQGIRTLG